MKTAQAARITTLIAATSLLSLVALSACSSAPEKKQLTKRERALLYVELANGALVEGDPTGALQALRSAEEFDPSLPEIYHSRALAFEAKKDIPTALIEAKKAAMMAPNSSTAQNTLGKLLLDSGRNAEAITPLSRAAHDPYYTESYKPLTNLGILYYRQGDYAKSEQNLNRAVQSSPIQSCHAHYYLGHIHLRKGEFDQSIREYERATQRFCARFADAHFALGIAFERSHRFDDARKVYLSIRSSFPRSQIADKAMDRLRDIP